MKEGKTIEKVSKKLLGLLGVEAGIEVLENSEGGFDVVLETEDAGIIIGRHGDVLEALQVVLSLCVSKELGEFVRISVEIGDYKKNRIEWLKNMAEETKKNVLESQEEIALPNLKSWERRIVHMFLKEDQQVFSESRGEGRDRVMVIAPKK